MGSFFIVIVVLLALMWLLIIRPQRRRQVAQRQMLGNLAEGDEVVTAGGLYGTIRALGDDEVTLEIAPEVEVRVAKRAVAAVIPPENEEEEEGEGEEEAPGAKGTEESLEERGSAGPSQR